MAMMDRGLPALSVLHTPEEEDAAEGGSKQVDGAAQGGNCDRPPAALPPAAGCRRTTSSIAVHRALLQRCRLCRPPERSSAHIIWKHCPQPCRASEVKKGFLGDRAAVEK